MALRRSSGPAGAGDPGGPDDSGDSGGAAGSAGSGGPDDPGDPAGSAGSGGPDGSSRRPSRTVTCAALAGATALAAVCGLAALFAAAALTPVPAVFTAAGLAVFLATGYAAAALVAARRMPPPRRRAARRTMFAAASLLPAAVFAWAALVPPPVPAPATVTVPGARRVEVSTGSRLEVLRLPARTASSRRPPVIVLHGGPGVPDLAANARVFAPLTGHGYDVYLYAQLGTGTSTRLADPRGYSAARDVADLEALRLGLGLDRVVLVGHSYGGGLAARYLAAHPDRVAGLVLISPGASDPADTSGNLASARLDTGRKIRMYAELLAPRALLGYGLLQVSPGAAHAFLPDAEADARNDRVLELAEPALHCRGARIDRPARGSGFYAMQYPQSAGAPARSDPRPALAGLTTPTLILKGSCDYLSWRSAAEYRRLLPRSRLIYLPGTGHNLHRDRPDTVLAAVLAFLDGRPSPVPPYEGAGPPAGYEGPP
ncbi:alpha/beta fold hydrolase [Streptosporangium sp. NPDC004379]|uniref:alpha/beta fold hydrolase n=1 Tax=Streptosporangium sp. NPDC004379 TaxID=3366189 RepID=UPI00367E68FD